MKRIDGKWYLKGNPFPFPSLRSAVAYVAAKKRREEEARKVSVNIMKSVGQGKWLGK